MDWPKRTNVWDFGGTSSGTYSAAAPDNHVVVGIEVAYTPPATSTAEGKVDWGVPGGAHSILAIFTAPIANVIAGNNAPVATVPTGGPNPPGSVTGRTFAPPGPNALTGLSVLAVVPTASPQTGALQVAIGYRDVADTNIAVDDPLPKNYDDSLRTGVYGVGCGGGGYFMTSLSCATAAGTTLDPANLGKVQVGCTNYLSKPPCCMGRGCYGTDIKPQTPECDNVMSDYCSAACPPGSPCKDPACACLTSPLAPHGTAQCFDKACAESAAYKTSDSSCDGKTMSCLQYGLLGGAPSRVAGGVPIPTCDTSAPSPMKVLLFVIVLIALIFLGVSVVTKTLRAKLVPPPPLAEIR